MEAGKLSSVFCDFHRAVEKLVLRVEFIMNLRACKKRNSLELKVLNKLENVEVIFLDLTF